MAVAWGVILQAPHLHQRSSAPPPQVANNRPLASSEPMQGKDEHPLASGQNERQVKAQGEEAEPHVATGQGGEAGARSSTNRKLQASVPDYRHQRSAGQAAPPGRAERAALDEPAGEVPTDFLPLGTCADSECMDEAMLIRVTLPAEALLVFGLPMESDYAVEQPVEADVIFGSDGVPFAIRFVN